MALSPEILRTFEKLVTELLERKDNFQALYEKMSPIIQYKEEFYVAFFLGYVAHNCKELFQLLMNRDMSYGEINETLEFLIDNEAGIRQALLSIKQEAEDVAISEGPSEPREIEEQPDIRIHEEEEVQPAEFLPPVERRVYSEMVDELQEELEELKYEVSVIKKVARNKIARYEVKQVRQRNR